MVITKRATAYSICLGLASGCAQPALAGEWTITPALSVDEKFTDNAAGTSSDEKADFVTTVAPSLAVKGEGKGLKLGFDYSLSYDRYAGQNDLDGFRHRGMALADAEVLEDFFFVDARGSVTEQEISTLGVTTAGDRTSASNRQRVATYSVTPQVKHRFGSWMLGQASYSHSESKFMTPAAGNNASGSGSSGTTTTTSRDSTTDGGKVQLRSGEDFSRLLWDLEGATTLNKRGDRKFHQTSETLRTEYKVTREFGILTHLGHDYLNDEVLDSDRYSGLFYGGGLHWAPSPRTDLQAEVGHRFDGVNVAVKGLHKLGAWTTARLSHSTGVTTDALQYGNNLGEVVRDEQGRFLDPFSGLTADPTASLFSPTDGSYKITTTEAALTYNRERDAVTLLAQLSEQETVSEGSTTTSTSTSSSGTSLTSDIKAATVSALWTHQLSEVLTGRVSISQTEILSAASATAEGTRFRAGLDLLWQMNPTLQSQANYRFVDTQPEQGAGVTENMVSIGLRKQF